MALAALIISIVVLLIVVGSIVHKFFADLFSSG
jgi:hypothetical protein